MATKFTALSMARMSQLFSNKTELEVLNFASDLADEAAAAGVYAEANGEGLTMAQWTIVRTPRQNIREAVLAAE